MPQHIISESEWKQWVAGSGVPVLLWHRTQRSNADSIRRLGLRVSFSQHDYCRGIYLSVEPWTMIRHEIAEFRGVARLTHPVRVREIADLPELVRLPRFGADPAGVRMRLLDRGHDGAITERRKVGPAAPTQFILALHDEAVRLVI